MTRSRKLGLDLAEGAAVHISIMAVGIGAMAAWAGLCEARRRRSRSA